jgi:multidrug efflux pump subunit AcrA (membrane-fusion protein)
MSPFNFGRSINARVLILFVCGALLSTACGRSGAAVADNKNTSSAPSDEAISVRTAKAESRQVPSVIQATGSLVAEEISNIAPNVAGKIVNVSANVGQFVTRGDVIARLDDQDAKLRLAAARTGVVQAEAAVRQAEARLGLSSNGSFTASTIPEVRAAGAALEQTEAELRQAEANEKRYRELVETGDVALITYEQFRTTRDTARSRVNSAKQQLEAAINAARQNNEAIRSAKAGVEAARAQVATAEQAVKDAIIRAPFSGYISDRPVAVGEFANSATTIATIVRTNPIRVQLQIAEAEIPSIKIGRGVAVQVDAYKDRSFAGTVSAVNPAVSTDSRSAIVEALIENNDNKLRAGMFATASVTRDGGTVGVFVPKEAVFDDQSTQNKRVFVIVEGVIKVRTVKVGSDENGMTRILDGVAADELVATSNLGQLYEGAVVKIG